MKWIEIAKAKPKFKQGYLTIPVLDDAQPRIARLHSSTETANGTRHTFTDNGGDNSFDVTHIALITLPGAKEAGDE